MKPGMKVLAMDRVRRGNEQPRSEYGANNRRMIGYNRDHDEPGMNYPAMPGHIRQYPPYGGYDMNGGYDMPRNGYDMPRGNGYDAPRSGYNGGTESRRRRDSRGRYMMGGGSEYDDDDDDDKYRLKGGRMIAKGAIWTEGEEDDDWCEKLKRKSFKPVDEHQAMEWVSEMTADNDKPMPFFHIEDTENQRKVMCPECDKWEFFVAMNAMYADFQPAGQKYGAGDKPEFYALMAKLFLNDKDAGRHKLQKYMMVIPK